MIGQLPSPLGPGPIEDPAEELARQQIAALQEQAVTPAGLPAPQLPVAPAAILPAPALVPTEQVPAPMVPEQATAAMSAPVLAQPAPEAGPQQQAPGVRPVETVIPAPQVPTELPPVLQLEGLAVRSAQTRARLARAGADLVADEERRVAEVETKVGQRQEKARVAQARAQQQVAEDTAALRQGLATRPELGGRQITGAAIAAAGEVLAAALDRSGRRRAGLSDRLQQVVQTHLRDLPLENWQRQIAELQGRRGLSMDQLGEAQAEVRTADQARAMAEAEIYDRTERELRRLGAEGQADLAALEAEGVLPELQMRRDAALAEAQSAAAEAQRDAEEAERKRAKEQAEIALIRERQKSERAGRAVSYARAKDIRASTALAERKANLEERMFAAKSEKEARQAQREATDLAIRQGELEAQDRERTVHLPGGPIKLNNQAEWKQAVEKVTVSAKVIRLADEIVLAYDEGKLTPTFLGSPEGAKLRARWTALGLTEKERNNLGVLSGNDWDLITAVIGEDPTKLSLDALRTTETRMRELRDQAEQEMDEYLSAVSTEYVQRGQRYSVPRRERPEKGAVTSEAAAEAIAPPRRAEYGERAGERPTLDDKSIRSNIGTMRESLTREAQAGQATDELTGATATVRDVPRLVLDKGTSALTRYQAERSAVEAELAEAREASQPWRRAELAEARARGIDVDSPAARQRRRTEQAAAQQRAKVLAAEAESLRQQELALRSELRKDHRRLSGLVRRGMADTPENRAALKAWEDIAGGLEGEERLEEIRAKRRR